MSNGKLLQDPPSKKTQGTWLHRLAVRLFTIAFAVLFYWLLGFFLDDIQSSQGVSYSDIEKQYVDKSLVEKGKELEKQISSLKRQMQSQKEKKTVLSESSANLQQTINQLLELQKLGMEKNISLSQTQEQTLASSLNLFLENQKKFQTLSEKEAELVEQVQVVSQEKTQVDQTIDKQQEPARKEFSASTSRHRIYTALYQFAILLPILLLSVAVIVKKSGSIYFPFYLSISLATALKMAWVAQEYFPEMFTKYLFILVLLMIVGWLLIHFIRAIAYPKAEWLFKQYREGYESFFCPVCEYPIRTGPRRFLFWTRRTLKKLLVPATEKQDEEAYTCPACGSTLFEECDACHKIKHALLPHCQHCGQENKEHIHA